MTLDPVDYAVISQALLAAAREMGTKLVRSAYSNIVREARAVAGGKGGGKPEMARGAAPGGESEAEAILTKARELLA